MKWLEQSNIFTITCFFNAQNSFIQKDLTRFLRQDFWQNFWQNPKCRRPRTYKFLQGIFSVSLKKDLFFKFIYIYIHTYIYIYIYILYVIYIYLYISGYHPNGFVATHKLGHMMYGSNRKEKRNYHSLFCLLPQQRNSFNSCNSFRKGFH